MIQILVIEDEKRVADLLKIGLEENGYQVTSSSCHPKIFIKYTTKRCEFFGFYLYFAMPDEVLFDYYSNTKLSEFSDMAKSLATFCCSGFYKRENLQCCGIKVNLTNTIGELLNN